MPDLKTDYKDDVLDTSRNTARKYRLINNPDGTISLEDVTVYLEEGDIFSGADINKTNEAVNAGKKASGIEFEDTISIGATDVQNALVGLFNTLGNQVTFELSGNTLSITTKE